MEENTLQRIIRKTGRKPSVCRCEACRNQCRTPCLGTPDDVLRLIEAGYREKLSVTYWCVGMFLGRLSYPILMVQAVQTDAGWCVFFHDGLCELHDKGLKPTEGRLSHHSIAPENFSFHKSLSYQVAKEWMERDNVAVIGKVFSYFGVSVTLD